MKQLVHGGDIYSEEITCDFIDFSANINPFGIPDSVKQAIIDNLDKYSYYPDPLCRELREAIARHENTLSKNVVCGNGAADIIFRIALALKPKQALLISPTFSEYEEAIKLVDGEIKYYDLEEKGDFYVKDDILEYITSDIDIMFVCNPNNPTGIPLIYEKMIKIADKCKQNNVILVVDECFIDFLKNEEEYSVSKYIKEYDNLIILKAFTKIYAMAGIRLGYMLSSNEDIINKISGIGQPWSVSTVASKGGIAALEEIDYVNKTKEYIDKNRDYLIKELKKLDYKVFDSKANFIFFKSENSNIKNELKKYGILIRACENYKNLNDKFFRIAVKSEKDNKKFIEIMRKIGGDGSEWQ